MTEFTHYKVNFIYLDGKDMSVLIKKENLNQFFVDLRLEGCYWNADKTQAFYTDLEKVRVAQVLATNRDEENITDEITGEQIQQQEKKTSES